VIFIDTSAIYALASRSDVNHFAASTKFASIMRSNIPLVTHSYVIVESIALLQHRLGLASAVRFENESRWFDVEWITPEVHAEAVRRWSVGSRDISFVDHVSRLVMQLRRIDTAFAFDDDLATGGVRLY
jgi:uncharacterized protein